MKKVVIGLLFGLFFMGQCMAIALGELQVKSHLNSPLEASLDIHSVGDLKLSDVKVSMAPIACYEYLGMTPPNWLDKIEVSVLDADKETPRIKIKTKEPITDLYANLVVQLRWAEYVLTKRFIVLFEPSTPIASEIKETDVLLAQQKIVEKLGQLEERIGALAHLNQELVNQNESLRQQMLKMAKQQEEANKIKPVAFHRVEPTLFFDLMDKNPTHFAIHTLQAFF